MARVPCRGAVAAARGEEIENSRGKRIHGVRGEMQRRLKTMKRMAFSGFIAAALVGAALAGSGSADADTVRPANDCVDISKRGTERHGNDYSVRLLARNACDHAVTVHIKSNSLGTDCMPGSFNVGAGKTYRTHVALVPQGETAKWNWCAEYASDAVQDRSGYRGCILSGQPTCP